MKKYLNLVLIAILAILSSCTKDNFDNSKITEKEFNLVGSAQKGPFINGSDINIYELDENFNPTGRTFHTNTDARGYFELKGVKLTSNYVEILADGFYFNEVLGVLSNEKLTLKTIADISEQENININVLTNLEYERVKYLIKTKGNSIKDAKVQSQKELLKVFNIDAVQINNSEALDIIKSTEGDAVLLAVSAILQAYLTTSELSKLQADIVFDMKEDGILNDSTILTLLISNAATLNLDGVRRNLVTKYAELGIELENINDFDTYIKYFVEHSNITVNSPFTYPASTTFGANILALDATIFQLNTNYALAAEMPNAGELMIKIKRTEGNGFWWYSPMMVFGWKVSIYNEAKNEQTFTSTINGDLIDLPINFSEYGVAIVEYYFNESLIPSYTKTITWGAYNNSDFRFLDDSPMGPNLLAINDSSIHIKSDSSYTIGIYHDGLFDVNFKLHLAENITVAVLGGWGDYTYSQSDNQLDFKLKNESNIAEIALKFSGEGQIYLESDLQFKDGSYLSRIFYIDR
jgi:hypothetical protein